MVKTTKQDEVSAGHRKTVNDALNYVDREFGAWFILGGKFAAVFGAWISLMLLGRRYVTAPDMLELIAIGYWFAWMFVIGVLAVGLIVGVSGWLDQLTRSERQSKY
jgi:hypothetical protein